MENNAENNINKKKNYYILIIVILSLIIVGLTSFIIYDKLINKDDKPSTIINSNNKDNNNGNKDEVINNESNTINKDDYSTNDDKENNNTNNIVDNTTSNNLQNNGLDEWMNYILSQNITSIQLNRYVYDDDDTIYKATLTKDELTEIFKYLSNLELFKVCISGSGFTYGNELIIKYTDSNNKSKEVKILENSISYRDNDELVTYLNKSKYTLEGNENCNISNGDYYQFYFKNFNGNNLDKYFK